MSAPIGVVHVDVVPSARGFIPKMLSQINLGEADKVGKDIGERIAGKVGEELGKTVSKGLGDGIDKADVRGKAAKKGKQAADAFGRSLKGAIDKALKDLPNAKVKVDVDEGGLSAIRKRLAALGKKAAKIKLDGAGAIAEAAKIRGELQALLGDTDIKVRFDAAQAVLGLHAFERQVGETIRRAEDLGAGEFARNLRAQLTAALDGLPEIKLTADSSPVDAALARVRAEIEALRAKRINFDIDDEQFFAELAKIKAELVAIGHTTASLTLKADVDRTVGNLEQVLDRNIGAFGTKLRSAVQGALTSLPEVQIRTNLTQVEGNLAILREQLRALGADDITPDLDPTRALAEIAAIRAGLVALQVDAGDALKHSIDEAIGSLDSFGTELNRRADEAARAAEEAATKAAAAADKAAGAFATSFRDKVQGLADSLPELHLRADASDATRTLDDVKARLATLAGKRIGIDIDGGKAIAEITTIENLLRSLPNNIDVNLRANAAKLITELAAVRTEAVGLDGDFRTIGDAVDAATSSAGRDFAQVAGHLSHIQLIAIAVAAAFPFVAAAILGVVGAASLVIAPVGAIALGMDGIKKAATPLLPLFNQLKKNVSAVFAQNLGPALTNLTKLFPTLNVGLTGTALALSSFADKLTQTITTSANLTTIADTFQVLRGVIEGLAPSAQLLSQNLIDLANIGAQGLAGLGDIMTQVGETWRSTIQTLADTGVAQHAIDALFRVFGSLLELLAPLTSAGALLLQTFGPPLASALTLIANILTVVSNALAAIPAPISAAVIAFLGFKAVGAIIAAVRGQAVSFSAVASGLGAKITGGIGAAATRAGAALTSLGQAFRSGQAAALQAGTITERFASTLARVPIAGAAASAAVSKFGSATRGAATLVGKGLGSALSGIVGVLGGPWGVALTAATVGLSLLGQRQADAAQAAQQHQIAVDDLAQALQQSSGVATAQVRELVASKQSFLDASKAAQEFGISSQTVLEAATGNNTALQAINSTLDQTTNAIGETTAEYDAAHDSLGFLAGGVIDANRLFGDQVSKASDAKTQIADLAKTYADAVAKQQALDAALLRQNNSLVGGVGAAKEVAAGLKALGEESSTTSQRISGLQQALHGLFSALNNDQSVASLEKAIDDLAPAAQKAISSVGGLGRGLTSTSGAINVTTEAGRNLLDAVVDLSDSTVAAATAAFDGAGGYNNLGAAQAAARAEAEKGLKALNDSLDPLHKNAAAVQAVAERYGLIPSLIVSALVLKGIPQATQQLAQVNTLVQQSSVGATIPVGVLSQPAISALQQIQGLTVTLNGDQVSIRIDTAEGQQKLRSFLSLINASTGTPTVDPKIDPAGRVPGLKTTVDQLPLKPQINPILDPLGVIPRTATQVNGLQLNPAIDPSTALVPSVLGQVTSAASGTKAEVQITANGQPALDTAHTVQGAVGAITAPPPIPIAADGGPALQVCQQVQQAIDSIKQGSPPTITINDQASGPLGSIQAKIDALHDKTVTITTVNKTVTQNAAGNFYEHYARGGMRNLRPMSGRSAKIVQPNTWRVIGDRTRNPEAFIPIDGSKRSMALLSYTANRMGRQIVPLAEGGVLERLATIGTSNERLSTQQVGAFAAALKGSVTRQTSATAGGSGEAPLIGTLNLVTPPGASPKEYSDELMFSLRHYRHGGVHGARIG